MPRAKKAPEPEPRRFGDLDGEVIEIGAVALRGGGAIDVPYGGGERVVFVVEALIDDDVTIKRIDGRLVRVHRAKIDRVAPPAEQLADEAAKFLQAYTDELQGRAQLPLEEPDEEEQE